MRPRYQHYYFGDYYAANYHDAGYYPSYSVNSSRFGYDPIYAYDRWQHRQDGEWEQRVAATYQNRRDHAEARPPRIWANQGVIGGGGVASAVRNLVGESLDQASRSRNGAWRFQPVDPAERQRLSQHGQEVYRFRDQRQEWETKAAVALAADPAHRGEPDRMKLPPSPIVARPADQLGKDYTPPKDACGAPARQLGPAQTEGESQRAKTELDSRDTPAGFFPACLHHARVRRKGMRSQDALNCVTKGGWFGQFADRRLAQRKTNRRYTCP